MGEQTKGIGLGRWQLSLLEIKPCHDSLLGKDNYKDTKKYIKRDERRFETKKIAQIAYDNTWEVSLSSVRCTKDLK